MRTADWLGGVGAAKGGKVFGYSYSCRPANPPAGRKGKGQMEDLTLKSLKELKANTDAAKSQLDLVAIAVQNLIEERDTKTSRVTEEIIYPSAEMLEACVS
jgi:hypothetical protein